MVENVSLANVAPLVTALPAGAGAKGNVADRGSSRPERESAASDSAAPKSEDKSEARASAAESNLTVLDGRRLSILQDRESQRFVYRGLNAVTNEVEAQYPSEADLARAALLRELAGALVDVET